MYILVKYLREDGLLIGILMHMSATRTHKVNMRKTEVAIQPYTFCTKATTNFIIRVQLWKMFFHVERKRQIRLFYLCIFETVAIKG